VTGQRNPAGSDLAGRGVRHQPAVLHNRVEREFLEDHPDQRSQLQPKRSTVMRQQDPGARSGVETHTPTCGGSRITPAKSRHNRYDRVSNRSDARPATSTTTPARRNTASRRHSAASLLSAAGVPLEEIADVLGHTSTRILEQHYRHQVKPSIDAHVGAMESLFG
jgi:integrase